MRLVQRLVILAFGSALGLSGGAADAQQLQTRERYQLHNGDQIAIEYTYTPEFNQTVTVQPDGFVSLKVGQDVRLAGKSLGQAKAAIEQSAGTRLKDPAVTLTLVDFQKPYFVVAGEAFAPMKYEMRDDLTVLQGLMMAGGIKGTGKEKQVVLIHGVNTPSPEVHVLDLKHVARQTIFEHDMALSSGDIIYVPRNKLTHAINLMQLINSPAAYGSIASNTIR